MTVYQLFQKASWDYNKQKLEHDSISHLHDFATVLQHDE